MNKILQGDALEKLKELDKESIDTVITDPPYGLEFMGKDWDSFSDNEALQEWTKQWALEALRVAKPGAIMLCFGGTRTFHRIACGIEDAGWEIRDTMMWLYGSGFPKSHNIGKAVDKLQGNERKRVRRAKSEQRPNADKNRDKNKAVGGFAMSDNKYKTKGTSEWEGYGTALKPAYEPILVAMKPLNGTYAENALKHGVAGLNIDEGRVEYGNETDSRIGTDAKAGGSKKSMYGDYSNVKDKNIKMYKNDGRFPANIVHDGSDEVVSEFPNSKSSGGKFKKDDYKEKRTSTNFTRGDFIGRNDSGSAARFFYCAKASKSERNMGLEEFKKIDGKKLSGGGGTKSEKADAYQARKTSRKNTHPTVKPLALMEYLVKLTKMPSKDQVYLDPFIGSGTTAMAVVKQDRNYIGIEQDKEYIKIAKARIKAVEKDKEQKLL